MIHVFRTNSGNNANSSNSITGRNKNYTTTRTGYLDEEKNTDKMQWIIGNCVTKTSKFQYTNRNFKITLWVFDEDKPLKTIFLVPWMMGEMDHSLQIDSNNRWHLKLLKVCKDAWFDIPAENNKFTILLHFFEFINIFQLHELKEDDKKEDWK